MISLSQYINEQNDKVDWEVYVDGKLDDTFTSASKKWKKQPKVGNGWYAGGTVFKIVKIEGNKVYTEEDK